MNSTAFPFSSIKKELSFAGGPGRSSGGASHEPFSITHIKNNHKKTRNDEIGGFFDQTIEGRKQMTTRLLANSAFSPASIERATSNRG
jgi:hypothetical protein